MAFTREIAIRRLTKATGTVAQEARSARDRLVSQEKLVKELSPPPSSSAASASEGSAVKRHDACEPLAGMREETR